MLHRPPFALCLASALALSACASRPDQPGSGPRPAPAAPIGFPTTAQLPAQPSWRAEVALDLGNVGIWTVKPVPVFAQYPALEVVGLDDRGRCHVLVPYAGRWTHFPVAQDNSWLGALTYGDVDPRVPGTEMYVGAESGAVYQVVGHGDGIVDARRAARVAGHAVHTLVALELDPERPGRELLAFTEPPGVYQLVPRAHTDGMEVVPLGSHRGRVRDAVLLPGKSSRGTDRVVLASRAGHLELIDGTRAADGNLAVKTLWSLPMGLGRLALGPDSTAERVVLYSASDDGLIHRHEGPAEGPYATELIYAGPTGPRGLAAGRFHEDPQRESIAVYGYAARVELLTRPESAGAPWDVELIFQERGSGHWLAAGEYDGRNGTDELLLCGFGGRIVMLAREPGYGLKVRASKE